jgi:uncharacterized protein YdhG (YjbR/CyaY superfamily)
MARKPETIDEYMAGLSGDQRAALEKVRRAIRAAVPKVEECISYQIPSFRLDGRMLVSFAAWGRHCAFYPGKAPIEALGRELAAYDTAKGTIRFPADAPLSAALVRKLIKVRIAERMGSRKTKR